MKSQVVKIQPAKSQVMKRPSHEDSNTEESSGEEDPE